MLTAIGSLTVGCHAEAERLHQQQTSQNRQTLQLEVPEAGWESTFFAALEQRTRAAGLQSLRTIVLPEEDLEIRFWYDHFEVISGVVVRRTGQEWSAEWIDQIEPGQPSSVRKVKLSSPTSGWEALWKSLLNAGILTIPDSSHAKCKTEALDGIGYVVEANVSRKYRTYRYGNPGAADCPEAKQMLQLEKIIGQELSLPPTGK